MSSYFLMVLILFGKGNKCYEVDITMKKALITGIYGQDGSYLCELLNNDNYEVHGVCKNVLSRNSQIIRAELTTNLIRVKEHIVSLYDYTAIKTLIDSIKPDVIFHMAAIHRGSVNKDNNSVLAEKELYEKNILATNNILTACYEATWKARIVSAGSCLMYDGTNGTIQDESTEYKSNSMYGMAKIAEQNLVEYYRKKGLFACVPILYNHESHRRAGHFVTKKIVDGLRAIKSGESQFLELGDLNVKKDWGYAKDYAMAMKLMSEAPMPCDYIISSGEMHSLKEFIELCAIELGISNWEKYIKINPEIITRKNNVCLRGNPQKCIDELGWKRTLSFEDLVREMVNN